jgi:putative tributyrin esterase
MAFVECQIKSYVLEMNVSVNVLIPQDIKKDEKVKVLYLLHGYIGNQTDWMRYSSIERYAQNHRLAIIMPAAYNSYYTNIANGFKYFTYISEELPDIMESMFPISSKREDNYVCGLSMGGYGAFKIALTFPNKFSKAASLSGALDVDTLLRNNDDRSRDQFYKSIFGSEPITNTKNDLFHLVKNAQPVPDLYIGCGTEDFLYDNNLQFIDFLKKHQIPYTYEASKGEHNWAFWDAYIQKVLKWLYKS